MIEKGDTLYSLGQRYRVSVSDIMRANPYVNVYNLRIGEELCIPIQGQRPLDNEYQPIDDPYPFRRTMPGDMMPDDAMGDMIPDDRMPEDMMPEDMIPDDRMPEDMMPLEQGMYGADDNLIHEMEVRTDSENSFSEDDSIKEVMDKLGISMSDLLQCIHQKIEK